MKMMASLYQVMCVTFVRRVQKDPPYGDIAPDCVGRVLLDPPPLKVSSASRKLVDGELIREAEGRERRAARSDVDRQQAVRRQRAECVLVGVIVSNEDREVATEQALHAPDALRPC